ncbi:MAG: hypothetical protein QM764_01960 [Chitinophagaceae bacterium]
MFRPFLRLFIYSNVFIACCAVAMVYQTYQLMLQQPPDFNLLYFVFFATITSYSFHWYLTYHSEIPSDRIQWTNTHRYIHVSLFIIGLLGVAYFFFSLIKHWPWLILSAVITFLYSAPKIPQKHFRLLRKIAVGKTIFLAFVWMYATTILPVLVSGKAFTTEIIYFIAGRFFLIYAICILFDYRDRNDDKAAGIRSMITYLTERGIDILFAISLIAFVAFTFLMLNGNSSLKSVVFLLIPGIITATLYNYGKRTLNDLFFYFILDGLMMFSSLLMIIFGI